MKTDYVFSSLITALSIFALAALQVYLPSIASGNLADTTVALIAIRAGIKAVIEQLIMPALTN